MTTVPMPKPVTIDAPAPDSESTPLTADMLVDEVSIDGMCGVY